MLPRFYRHVRPSGAAELVATPRDVLQDKLASLSPCGDERAAGPIGFLSLGRVLSSSCIFILTSGFRGRRGWLRHRGPCGGRHLRRPSRRQGCRRWGLRLVWADGAAACVCLGRFSFPPVRVEGRLTVCDSAGRQRVKGTAACSQVRPVGSLVDCCTLRAVGWRSGDARGPSSCGGRGTS